MIEIYACLNSDGKGLLRGRGEHIEEEILWL